jgi:hypothetical protein
VEPLGAGHAALDLHIGVASLSLIPEAGLRKGEVDVMILQRDETGDIFRRVNETIQMGFRDSTYNNLLAGGLPHRLAINLDPRATVIRVVVRDSATGNLGSLTIPAKAIVN